MKLSLPEDGRRTIEWQEAMLSALVEPAFVKQAPQVKGPFTSGEYVIWLLNLIFGPGNWSHRVIGEPTIKDINESQAYSQALVGLTVYFADGKQVTHEDVGIWPFSATGAKQGGTLEATAAERYEQVIKSASEVASMILRIDDVIASSKSPMGPPGGPPGAGMPEGYE